METIKLYFIAFAENGEVLFLKTLNKFFRDDIKFIIRRTYVKKSSGLKLFSYYKNELIDIHQNIIPENTITWGKIKCKFKEDEYYGHFHYYLDKPNASGLCLVIIVEDILGRQSHLSFNTHHYDQLQKEYTLSNPAPFELIRDDLNLLNQVGTCEALFKIKKLEHKIIDLNKKIEKLKMKKK